VVGWVVVVTVVLVDGVVLGFVEGASPPNSAPRTGATLPITMAPMTTVSSSMAHIMINTILFSGIVYASFY
jgi:hypothetical protein